MRVVWGEALDLIATAWPDGGGAAASGPPRRVLGWLLGAVLLVCGGCGVGYLIGNHDEPISATAIAPEQRTKVLGTQITRPPQGAAIAEPEGSPTTVPTTTTTVRQTVVTVFSPERAAQSAELRRQARERCLQLLAGVPHRDVRAAEFFRRAARSC